VSKPGERVDGGESTPDERAGCRESACSPPAHSLISDYFPAHKRAMAFSLYSIGLDVGLGLGFILGGWIGGRFGWRARVRRGGAAWHTAGGFRSLGHPRARAWGVGHGSVDATSYTAREAVAYMLGSRLLWRTSWARRSSYSRARRSIPGRRCFSCEFTDCPAAKSGCGRVSWVRAPVSPGRSRPAGLRIGCPCGTALESVGGHGRTGAGRSGDAALSFGAVRWYRCIIS